MLYDIKIMLVSIIPDLVILVWFLYITYIGSMILYNTSSTRTIGAQF